MLMHPQGLGGQLGIGPKLMSGVTPGSIFSYFMDVTTSPFSVIV